MRHRTTRTRRTRLLAAICLIVAVAGCSSGPAVDQAVPGTVLLVPGYGGNVRDLDALRDLLRARGRTVVEVPTPDGGVGDLRGQATAVAAAARAALDAGAPSVDVVGYSAGGVVARLFVAEGGGADVVRRVVTIGSPHHGTALALLVGSALCPEACRQLQPGSDILTALPEPPIAPGDHGPVFTSLWTATDEVIVPPTSSVLKGALSIRLQDVCPDDASTHTMLPRTPLVGGLVLRALAETPLLVAPGPQECAAIRSGA